MLKGTILMRQGFREAKTCGKLKRIAYSYKLPKYETFFELRIGKYKHFTLNMSFSMRRMEIGPNRPMSIIFLLQKYVHDPNLWPIMNTAVANDIKILANTLLTQIEPPNPGCFGRGSLRLWSESIRSILMGRFGREMFLPRVVSARGGGGGGKRSTLIFSA